MLRAGHSGLLEPQHERMVARSGCGLAFGRLHVALLARAVPGGGVAPIVIQTRADVDTGGHVIRGSGVVPHA